MATSPNSPLFSPWRSTEGVNCLQFSLGAGKAPHAAEPLSARRLLLLCLASLRGGVCLHEAPKEAFQVHLTRQSAGAKQNETQAWRTEERPLRARPPSLLEGTRNAFLIQTGWEGRLPPAVRPTGKGRLTSLWQPGWTGGLCCPLLGTSLEK